MAFPILGTPQPEFSAAGGNPFASGTLSVLVPADDTNKKYYPTASDADADTNSATGDITLNSRGAISNALFGVDDETYKLVLKDSTGATIWTETDIRLPTRLPTLYGKTAQTLTDAGGVTITESTTFIVTTTASALTLVDGVENQEKFIVMKTDAGAATLTPTNLSNGTTIIFDDVGDSAHLVFVDGSWNMVSGSATITGHNAATAVTFTSTDATPTIADSRLFITAGTTAITDFDDGVVGDIISIKANSSIAITDNSNINLAGGNTWNMQSGDILVLEMFTDQLWDQVGRSTAVATTKFKIADETATNDSTLSDDTHLLNWILEPNTFYKLSGFLKVNTGASATPDIKFLFTSNNTLVEAWMNVHSIREGAAATQDSGIMTTAISQALTASEVHGITFSGMVLTHATSQCNVDFQWAQNTSDATGTVVERGSWMAFVPVDM